MNPRSLTPLWRMPRSSRRFTAWKNVACESENAMWCTQPGSVGVRVGSGTRSSLVNTVIRRPSPGSKYRWLSDGLSRLGCSKTNGMPSTPSQKSIDVRRSAPTMVMWWTPWLWSFLMVPGARRVSTCNRWAARFPTGRGRRGSAPRPLRAVCRESLREGAIRRGPALSLDADRQRRVLLDARDGRPDEDAGRREHGGLGLEPLNGAHDERGPGRCGGWERRLGRSAWVR